MVTDHLTDKSNAGMLTENTAEGSTTQEEKGKFATHNKN